MFNATTSISMTLTAGSRGSAVRQLQHSLNLRFQQLGILSGMSVRVDGYFGPETLASVKYLQCVCGLPVDGRVCDRTWAFITQGAAGLHTLSMGSTGTQVAAVQQTLLAVQIRVVSDGVFGELTAQAVKVYQHGLGLSASGMVGQETWEVIVRSRLDGVPCVALLPNLY